ncbi:WGR domain-containing protein [Komagataeibacter sp. FNDCR2]|uniref:WGR domain-containing protein n=1 Tax=Komagataeibacter sp. FNDCR2 TaxID=2878682 RepID=UPI001E54B96D|nr:WGR domain-containing protein [Komagataeibacter sp. FNDCR2]MCE2576728.1 WGR domain-containing protein [Komagataeibacter sp. FNDCR2]
MASPVQMSLFPLCTYMRRIHPEKNEWRYYAMTVQPDLFGGAALLRRWGRIGSEGTTRLDLYTNEGEAANALAALVRHRKKRGYQVISCG